MKKEIYKTKSFWFAFLIGVYALVGFVVIPNIAKSQAQKFVKTELNHDLSIESIAFNPFLLKLDINNLSLKNTKTDLVAFENFHVDIELLKSILESHINIKEISLKNPQINVEIYKNGSLNFDSLKQPSKEQNTTKIEKNSNSTIPKVRIQKFAILGAGINFNDQKNDLAFKISDLEHVYYNLNTFSKSLASQSLSFNLNKETSFNLDGGLYFDPMMIYGEISLKNLIPNEFLTPSIKNKFNFNLQKSKANISLAYEIRLKPTLDVRVEHSNFELLDLALIQENKKQVALNRFAINNIYMQYPQQKVDISEVLIDTLYANVELNKDKTINLTTLIKKEKENNTTKNIEKDSNKTQNKAWDIDVAKISLANSKIDILDKSKNFKTDIKNINFNLNNFNLREKSIFDYDSSLVIAKAPFSTDGKVSIKPFTLDSNYKLSKFSFSQFQPYVDDFVNINLKSADFYSSANIKIENNTTKIKSNHSLKKLFVSNKENVKLLSTKELNVNTLKFDTSKNALSIKKVDIIEPFAFVHIDKNKNMNLANLTKKDSNETNETNQTTTKVADANTSEKTKDNKQKLEYKIGSVNFKNASMKFVDLSLPLPFGANITKLKGGISKLDSTSIKPSKLDLDGVINEYGYARINGEITPTNPKQASDIAMQFKNVAMKDLTPYTGKFLGRKIDSGKLSLDLRYKIVQSQLQASNSLVIHKIKLGDEVNSSDAMNLPLSLAIALLEDSNGVIDLAVPVSGDVDSPEFAIAPVIFKTLGNIITKVITSPFSFLASLLGVDEEKLNNIQYESGHAKLTPPAIETLDNIVKVLEKRPNLAVNMTPAYNLQDKKVLAKEKLEKRVDSKIKELEKNKKIKDTYTKALEVLYTKKKLGKLETIKKESSKTIKDKIVLDKTIYADKLKTKLIKNTKVSKKELEILAKKRAQNSVNYLNSKNLKDRITINNSIQNQNNSDKWLKLDLKIKTK